MKAKIKASQVKFHSIPESGAWSAAYISTPASEDGVMFFETVNGKKHFREVWGGWADPSETPGLTAPGEEARSTPGHRLLFCQHGDGHQLAGITIQ
ncbi:hypothetical protein ACFFP0_26630 [Rhizobium puerariae]|uniref:Uncharacterized protein n=1 Tax=Rhizobium puerariae TaxID=1585791 RepID=A0ABV6AT02_9HYPH